MKVKVKSPFIDRNGLHKRNDIVEIEARSFNPYTMIKIESAPKAAPIEEKPEIIEEEAIPEAQVERPKKKKRKG